MTVASPIAPPSLSSWGRDVSTVGYNTRTDLPKPLVGPAVPVQQLEAGGVDTHGLAGQHEDAGGAVALAHVGQ